MRLDTIARVTPARDAVAVAVLSRFGPFGSRDVLVVLGQVASDGDEWVQVELPMAPNGTTGWVPRDSLGDVRTTDRTLTVDTTTLLATLVRGGRELWSAPIGIGTTDWPTPRGLFYVRARVVPSRSMPLYGAFAFCTSCIAPEPWPGGKYLAIHGTNRPEKIPGHVSRGCIRLRDDDVLRLRPLLPLGARVSIG